MPTGLYIRYLSDADLQKFKPRQNKSRSFGKMVISYFPRMRPDCRIESFYTTGTQIEIDFFNPDGFCAHCNTVFESMGCFYHYCPRQEARPTLTEEDIQRGTKKEGTGWNAEAVYWGERLHCCPIVGKWMLETLQDWRVRKKTHERIIPKHLSIASGPVIGQDKIRCIVWERTMWYQTSRTSEKTNCQFTANLSKNKRTWTKFRILTQQYTEKDGFMSQPWRKMFF